MDIEEFYDADPRRRESAEIEMGRDWRDAHGVRYELSWVEDTGELYVMREPVPKEWADPFGGVHVSGSQRVDEREAEAMTVVVLGTLGTRPELESALDGWEQQMNSPDGVRWLAERLRQRGIGPRPAPPAPATA
ncbi:MAG: hypothetical protein ACRDY3_04765 [Acidimicrobiales bacterium]